MNRALFPIEIEERRLLIDAPLVREILGEARWLPVPRSSDRLPGVLPWKGRALPVFALEKILDLGSKRAQARVRTVIAEVEGDLVALPIDGAREVVSLSADLLLPLHAAPMPFGTAEVRFGDELATVIDLPGLVRRIAEEHAVLEP